MKICHVCLSCFFVDGRLYQENELVIQHIADGHEVTVIASTETHDSAGSITYANEGAYVGVEGANIIRLRYRRWLPGLLMRKLRMHPGLPRLLRSLSPDAILFHGAAGWELLNVARYAKDNPSCAFYIDSHTDFVNSAHGWLSRTILHGLYYQNILRHAIRVAGPLLCVSTSVMDFANKIYRIPMDNMEFFPLGGRPLDDSKYLSLRSERRHALGLSDANILVVQSGKQSRAKRLLESIGAFIRTKGDELRFIIAGVIQEDVRAEAETLIMSDDRIKFIGWQDGDALTSLLCAADSQEPSQRPCSIASAAAVR